MNESDKLKFTELAKTGVRPNEFYSKLKAEGVSKFDIFLLLRDEYSLGLVECSAIADEVDQLHQKDS